MGGLWFLGFWGSEVLGFGDYEILGLLAVGFGGFGVQRTSHTFKYAEQTFELAAARLGSSH